MLHTLRCPGFEKEEGVEKAAETLSLNNVDGLVVIGGDGSFRGALDLSRESETLMAGVPATIDNDVFGTDETVGFDTAVNTGVTEIDKIRDTALSHERLFIVEVMGRKRGFIALEVGISVGAEVILVPEHGSEVRLTILGYAQRGGSPTARSRLLASLFAEKAVDLLVQEQGNKVVGLQNGAITSMDLEKSCETQKPLDLRLLELAEMLAI
jgi:6-phosphofructokinase 1